MKRLLGRTIAKKYLVRDVLGRGGNAVVFEALDKRLQRPVAIKVPTTASEDADLVLRRFRREMRASGSIVHPNVCAAYESGTLDDGTPFLVMERLEGESLAELLRREPCLSLDRAITIFSQILSGLAAAHARNILHRDIKLANIFLSQVEGYDELVKILDFGASKRIGPTPDPDLDADTPEDLTSAGFVFGTPSYMAPEQIRAQPLDARCDLFACGAVLFEALAGERLYRETTSREIFREIIASPARTVRSVKPSLPPEVDGVVRMALRRNPGDRYPSATAFRKALGELARSTASEGAHLASTQENERATRLRDLKRQFHELAERHRATQDSMREEIAARQREMVVAAPALPSVADEVDETATTERMHAGGALEISADTPSSRSGKSRKRRAKKPD